MLVLNPVPEILTALMAASAGQELDWDRVVEWLGESGVDSQHAARSFAYAASPDDSWRLVVPLDAAGAARAGAGRLAVVESDGAVREETWDAFRRWPGSWLEPGACLSGDAWSAGGGLQIALAGETWVGTGQDRAQGVDGWTVTVDGEEESIDLRNETLNFADDYESREMSLSIWWKWGDGVWSPASGDSDPSSSITLRNHGEIFLDLGGDYRSLAGRISEGIDPVGALIEHDHGRGSAYLEEIKGISIVGDESIDEALRAVRYFYEAADWFDPASVTVEATSFDGVAADLPGFTEVRKLPG
jgi:hypothetical protein